MLEAKGIKCTWEREKTLVFLIITTLKLFENWAYRGCSPHHRFSQKWTLTPAIRRQVWPDKFGKTWEMAFQWHWCNHLIRMLASQSFWWVPWMLKITICPRASLSLGNLKHHFPKSASFLKEISLTPNPLPSWACTLSSN